jgi:clan AA aspartic protease
MGHVYAEITLKNAGDVIKAKDGFIKIPEIRQAKVQAMVDTGATNLVINKNLFIELGLGVSGERNISFANNEKTTCAMTGPVELHWENRSFILSALVVDEVPEVLLGVVPLEALDLLVDPVKQKLVGAHGDAPLHFVYSC